MVKKNPKQFFRGDVFYCLLKKNGGGIQEDVHPVLIIQNDFANTNSTTLIVAAVTRNLKKPKCPTHVKIKYEDLLEPTINKEIVGSIVQFEHVYTVNKEDMGEYVASIHLNQLEYMQAQGISFGWIRAEERRIS